jgi:hypothetical protein
MGRCVGFLFSLLERKIEGEYFTTYRESVDGEASFIPVSGQQSNNSLFC